MTHSLSSKSELTLRDHIIILADAYAAKTGRSSRWISTQTFNDHHKIDLIRSGADTTTRSYEKALQVFSDIWPTGLRWPPAIKRPQKSQKVA